jgi:quinol monooxygenase YgiN
MLIVSGIISVDPSDHDAMVALIPPLVEATLAEDGNVTYGFWASPTEPGVFRVYEEWASPEAMGEHMATEHMATFLGGMGALSVTGTELHQHDVAASTRLM